MMPIYLEGVLIQIKYEISTEDVELCFCRL